MAGIAFVTFITACLVSVALTAPQSFMEAKMPASCLGKNYCHERSDDYPQELIDNLLEILDHKIEQVYASEWHAQDRDSGDDDCRSTPNVKPIREIVDSNGRVRFVIQSGEKFKQIVRTETCMNPGRLNSSFYFDQALLSEMDVSCTEKNMEYWFQVLSLDGENFEQVAVKGGLPVCCYCRLTE